MTGDPFARRRPTRAGLGRLNVAPSVPLPVLTDCRICGADLRVRRHVVFCPYCDRLQHMTERTPAR